MAARRYWRPRWAEVMGVPVKAESSLIPFPFDDPSQFDKEAIAFLFVTLTAVKRADPVSDKESMEIYFIPQRAAAPGHAIDSCFSLAMMNFVMNNASILEQCPQDIKDLVKDIFATENAAVAWRLFDESAVGDKVHRVHQEAHLLGEWDESPASPKFDKTPYSKRLKQQKVKEDEHDAKEQSTAPAPQRKSSRGQGGALTDSKGKDKAKQEQDKSNDKGEDEEEIAHHITVFMHINGSVWEIDSLQPEPRKIGTVNESEPWQELVAKYLHGLKGDIEKVSAAPQLTHAAAIYKK
ncbi:hypothetical protein BC939DRAFT_210507 [Gamsiella multidivaricata]|uniref:uncharacterized protein n=1 Tax=Gamsiella multidivaricata TaxID=101098 RepID=UPI002221217E|nr:uncharacterized protein BC939DRAFT_210507 [Gamsiella multidivaricata]KAI7821232.1 hypothetical protein BC939DRAFT_210507 [Gamsiella multidivaricata]